MGTDSKEERSTAEYLAQLLKDKKQIQAFPNVFGHLERLLDDEINKVRVSLFNLEKKPLNLPEGEGMKVTLTEKLYVPVKEHPDFNFVGRILGPRGITAKQLERDTGCKIMIRGKGSMRDKKKEEQMRGKPNWEHLSEDLHVLLVVEDTQNRAGVKMARAVEEVKKLLVPAPEGEDDLKKIQLMELAIMNGTYRDNTKALAAAAAANMTAAHASTRATEDVGIAGFPYLADAAAAHACFSQAQVQDLQQRMLGAPLTIHPQQAAALSAGLRAAAAAGMPPSQAAAAAAAAAAAGTPLILSPRQAGAPPLPSPMSPMAYVNPASAGVPPPPLVAASHSEAAAAAAAAAASGLFYAVPDYGHYGFPTPTLLDYSMLEPSAAGPVPKARHHAAAAAAAALRPYQRL